MGLTSPRRDLVTIGQVQTWKGEKSEEEEDPLGNGSTFQGADEASLLVGEVAVGDGMTSADVVMGDEEGTYLQ